MENLKLELDEQKNESKAVVVLPQEITDLANKVSEEKRAEVQNILNQVFAGTADWKKQVDAINVKDVNDKFSIQLADTARINAKNARLVAEKIFDSKRESVQQKKSEYDLEDKLWLKAKQTMQILFKDIEDSAKWKAETVKRFEAEQKELQTQLRIEKVKVFNPEIERSEIENMSESMFDIFLSGIEKSYNDKIETDKKAETERIAKEKAIQEEQERIRKENERLKKEAEEKEKALEIERKKQEDILAKQKAEADKKLSDERLKAETERKRIEVINQEKFETERKERERIYAELKAKEAKERAEKLAIKTREKEQKEAELKASLAPDKEKLDKWINAIELPKLTLSTVNATATAAVINEKLEAFKNWALKQIQNL